MSRVKLNFFRTAAFFAACACMVACEKPKQAQKKEAEIPTVEVARPLVRAVEVWDEYTARLDGEKSVEIRARVSGYLEKIRFQDGDYVKEGQLLFEIDPRPFEAIVAACKASVSEVEARIALAQGNMDRAQELMAANAISKELLESRKSELAGAKAILLSAQAKLREAQLDLEFTKIHSPISGYVSRRFVDEGNLVTAGTTLLSTIVSRDIVYAYFEVSDRVAIRYVNNKLFEAIDNKNKKGPAVELKLVDETKPSHFGYLSYVGNQLSLSSIELRANIDNKDGKLFPGMYGKVRLAAGKPEERLLIPELAIGTDLVGRYVYVVDNDNIVSYRPVAVGDLIGQMQIVLEGLSPDDRVVINGIQRAKPKAKVNAILQELE